MKLLAIETSTRRPSVALDIDGAVRCQVAPQGATTAQWLFPAIKQLFVDTETLPGQLESIALTNGPGSFTGLRIAVTAAKVLAFATDAEVIALNSLAVVAAQSGVNNQPVVAVMDAQRKELFVAEVTLNKEGTPVDMSPTQILSSQEWSSMADPSTLVTGPGLTNLTIPANLPVTDEARWYPIAQTVALIAQTDYGRRHATDLWALAPRYIRRSYAEP